MSSPRTAVVLIDPYNDFLHPEGKLYPAIQESLVATDAVSHMKELVAAARQRKVPIYYAMHQKYKQGNYMGWERMNVSTSRVEQHKVFEEGSWGAEFFKGLEPDVLGNGDVIATNHWNSSGFANTDLDFQLRQHGITHLVMTGMVANTCLESTARYARELGYHVTLLSDGTAGFSTQTKDAAVNLVWPIIVDSVMTVAQWIATQKQTADKL